MYVHDLGVDTFAVYHSFRFILSSCLCVSLCDIIIKPQRDQVIKGKEIYYRCYYYEANLLPYYWHQPPLSSSVETRTRPAIKRSEQPILSQQERMMTGQYTYHNSLVFL